MVIGFCVAEFEMVMPWGEGAARAGAARNASLRIDVIDMMGR